MQKPTCCALATITTLFIANLSHAAERPGFDPDAAVSLAGVPVHVVVMNDRLEIQSPFMARSEDRDAKLKTILRSGPSGYGGGKWRTMETEGGVVGALVGRAVLAHKVREAGKPMQPAIDLLRASGCQFDGGETFAQAVEAGIRTTAWGHEAEIGRHALPVKAEVGPRYEFAVSYSLTPDFAALVTTVSAHAHVPALPGARSSWERRPVWTDELVIVSDKLVLGAKTEADKLAAVERENAQYRSSGIVELARKANAGDAAAREEGTLINRNHKRALHDARLDPWQWHEAAYKRAGLWAENDCARLRNAVQANAAETTRVLGKLVAGQAGATLPPDWPPGKRDLSGEPAERRLYNDGPHITVSRRANDDVMLEFRYTWLPLGQQSDEDIVVESMGDDDAAGRDEDND
jgi:hypothetical protein